MELRPKEIFSELEKEVVGQQKALQYISVGISKHIIGEKLGNILMIGSSGTGKTLIMRAVEKLYNNFPFLEKFKTVVRFNAMILATENPVKTLFKIVEDKARSLLRDNTTKEKLQEYMECATICLDEIDKISAKIGDSANIPGIRIQESLLTLMEGEKIMHETKIFDEKNEKNVTLQLDTGKLFFLCAGAFEELYNYVLRKVQERREELKRREVYIRGKIFLKPILDLEKYLEPEDLYEYGMRPQFLSRFDNIVLLRDLEVPDLERILTVPDDAVLKVSSEYFEKMNIKLNVTPEAKKIIAEEAIKYGRIGARALKEVYGKVIKEYEFDPFSKGIRNIGNFYELTIDEAIVKKTLGR